MKKLLLYGFMLSGIALSATGCLKDEEHFTDFAGVGAIAEIPSSAFYGVGDNQGLEIKSTPVAYSFDVNIASPNPPTQDVTVTLAVDKATLDAYNKANDTEYALLPASLYQFPSLTTTVKAGTRLAPVNVSFFTGTDKVADPGVYNDAEYALPIKIMGTSNNTPVSSNYGYKIIILKIKNQYDGDYRSVGFFTHPTATSSRKIDRDKTLSTVDLLTVSTEYADLGAAAIMQLRINADNTVTLIPKGTASAATVQLGVNKYDPATKTYTLNYKYAGSGGDRVINEVITRK